MVNFNSSYHHVKNFEVKIEKGESTIKSEYLPVLCSIQNICSSESVDEVQRKKLKFAIKAETQSKKFRFMTHLSGFKYSKLKTIVDEFLKNEGIALESRLELAERFRSLSEKKSNINAQKATTALLSEKRRTRDKKANDYHNIADGLDPTIAKLKQELLNKHCQELLNSHPGQYNLSEKLPQEVGKITFHKRADGHLNQANYIDPIKGQVITINLTYPDLMKELPKHQRILSEAIDEVVAEEKRLQVIIGQFGKSVKGKPGEIVIQKASASDNRYLFWTINEKEKLVKIDKTADGLDEMKKVLKDEQVQSLLRTCPQDQFPNLTLIEEIPTKPDNAFWALQKRDDKTFLIHYSKSLNFTFSTEIKSLSTEGLLEAKAQLVELHKLGLSLQVSKDFSEDMEKIDNNLNALQLKDFILQSVVQHKNEMNQGTKTLPILMHTQAILNEDLLGPRRDVIQPQITHALRNFYKKLYPDQIKDVKKAALARSKEVNLEATPNTVIDAALINYGLVIKSTDKMGVQSMQLTEKGTAALLTSLEVLEENPNFQALKEHKFYQAKKMTETDAKQYFNNHSGTPFIIAQSAVVNGQLVIFQEGSNDKIVSIAVSPDWTLDHIDATFGEEKPLLIDELLSKPYFWQSMHEEDAKKILSGMKDRSWILHHNTKTKQLVISGIKSGKVTQENLPAEFSFEEIESKRKIALAIDSPQRFDKLKLKPYYWGRITSKEINGSALKGAVEGTWLIRYSEEQHRLVISQKQHGNIVHKVVEQKKTLKDIESEYGLAKVLKKPNS